MSTYSINTTINNLQLQGLQIFYDFNSFGAGGTVIHSIESGDTQYSGVIVNADVAFTGDSSGSGCFNGSQYISIQNTTGIQGDGFTMVFSQEKAAVGAGTIFSNLNPPSGFEVGITDANKLYYKNYINGTPSYQTFENYPSDKNLYAVSVTENGNGTLYRLNFGEKAPTAFSSQFVNANKPVNDAPAGNLRPAYYNLSPQNFLVPDYTIINGTDWRIGSGDYLYEGYMDYFLYFNTSLGADVLRKIARAVYVDEDLIPPTTGLVSGVVTGYQVTTTGVLGEIGSPSYITGLKTQTGSYTIPSGAPLTGAVGVSGSVYVPQQSLTGAPGSNLLDQTIYRRINNLAVSHSLTGGLQVSGLPEYYSSGSYWLFSGNSGTFNGDSGTGAPGTIFGITGFSITEVVVSLTGQSVDVFGMSGFSGSFYSGFSFNELRAPDAIYTGSGSYISGLSNVDESYFPNALSSLGDVDSAYFYELIYDISGAESINVGAENNRNITYAKNTAFMTGLSPLYQTNLAINGVSTFTGSISYGVNEYNFDTATVVDGFVTQNAEIFTELTLAGGDGLIYDTVESGVKSHLTITDTGDYPFGPFPQIDTLDTQIFFNGVKLTSGVDYTTPGGWFSPMGDVTEATGLYFTYPNYSGGVTVTGHGGTPISVSRNSITPNGYVLFFNGIRQAPEDIIEHARYSDLIKGTEMHLGSVIYNMINGEKQDEL